MYPSLMPYLFPWLGIQNLIIGGTPVALGELPYQVSLQTHNLGHFCGGSLVSMDVVITAAHCVFDKNLGDITVVAGVVRLSDTTGNSKQVSRVTKGMINPNFDRNSPKYDVAVLKLIIPFALTVYVQAIQLPMPTFTPTGLGRVSGWGSIREGSPNTDWLRSTYLHILDLEECMYYYGDDADETIFCASSSSEGDACNGDSGGPLACGHTTKALCGVISAGIGCGHSDSPGIYTNVGDFTNWILFVISQLGQTDNEN